MIAPLLPDLSRDLSVSLAGFTKGEIVSLNSQIRTARPKIRLEYVTAAAREGPCAPDCDNVAALQFI